MRLAYCKLSDAVCVDGRMVMELRDATASALGVVVASAGGNVLVPWHCVRWGVEAEAAPFTAEELEAAAKVREELAAAYESHSAAMSVPAAVAPEPAKAKRKR